MMAYSTIVFQTHSIAINEKIRTPSLTRTNPILTMNNHLEH